jgi:hypothetical protein
MKCPYCCTGINLSTSETVFEDPLLTTEDGFDKIGYSLGYGFCPECNNLIVTFKKGIYCYNFNRDYIEQKEETVIIYPKFPCTTRLNEYIPQKYMDLFSEAEQVNNISPRASATLSRYLLQMILHEELNIKKRNLEEEINELGSQDQVPSSLFTVLQILRRVANFAAHPKKSTHSAEIVEIEEGESTVMLALINELFDFVFVKPAEVEKFKSDMEEKFGIKCET